MSKKIVWRLASLPTAGDLRQLVDNDIISKDEAREILLNFEEVNDRDKKSFESEIKFLRELVEKLSSNQGGTKVVETIKYIEKPYYSYEWYKPYVTWCNSSINHICTTQTGTTTQTGFNNVLSSECGVKSNQLATGNVNSINPIKFSEIKTF